MHCVAFSDAFVAGQVRSRQSHQPVTGAVPAGVIARIDKAVCHYFETRMVSQGDW